jgi:predicted aconitase
MAAMSDAQSDEVDFVSLGCPHLSIQEIARLAELLEGKRCQDLLDHHCPPYQTHGGPHGLYRRLSKRAEPFSRRIPAAWLPPSRALHALATDSAKACYYAYAKNKFKTLIRPFDEVVAEALK